MKKPVPHRDDARRARQPGRPARDLRTVVIDRARHEIGGEVRVVEAVKIALVDLTAHREVEVSYALRIEGFLSASFAKKHEVVKALKEGDLESFLKDLAPIPAPAPGAEEQPIGERAEHVVGETDTLRAKGAETAPVALQDEALEAASAHIKEILPEDETTRADVVPTASAA